MHMADDDMAPYQQGWGMAMHSDLTSKLNAEVRISLPSRNNQPRSRFIKWTHIRS
jgi:hypothetical protein